MTGRRRWHAWTLAVAGWTLAGVFFATQTFVGAAYAGRALTWGQAFAVALTAWYVRGLFAPVVLWLSKRFPLARERRLRNGSVHVVASVALAVIEQILYGVAVQSMAWIPRRAIPPVEFHTNLLVYWALVGCGHGFEYYRKYRDRELAASQLAAQLSHARLRLLEGQLRPHFLFNTLNAIAELMHEDVERADLMIADLSDLLRFSLKAPEVGETSLGQEIDFTRRYLEIERTRFQDRLTVVVDVEADALDARVPSFILQPLVENAVRHGIAPNRAPGRVEVRGRRVDGVLRLEVRDDGCGLPADGSALREGVGLGNTRERLEQSYGSRQRLDVAAEPAGGVRVTIELPFRRAAAEHQTSESV